jgi:uncharacterized membrane-anchored protein YitT (DUF2179 family)
MNRTFFISILICKISFSYVNNITQEINFTKYIGKKNETLIKTLNEKCEIIQRSHLNNYNKYVVGMSFYLKDSTSIAVYFNNRWEINDSTSFDCLNNKMFFQSKIQSIYVYTKDSTYEYY